MRKELLLSIAAITSLTAAPALAADIPIGAPAPVLPTYSWTACYVGAGAGYGMWNQEVRRFTDAGVSSQQVTFGGRGWTGTVQGGCDYQVGSTWVIGAFADYDFGSLKGHFSHPTLAEVGDEKMKSSWAVGGRLGWTPFERLLTYFSAGYTQAEVDRINLTTNVAPFTAATGFYPSHTYTGWFLGSGYEYAVSWLPGFTWKTEYRFADYSADDLRRISVATGLPVSEGINSHKYVQSVRTELVWRF